MADRRTYGSYDDGCAAAHALDVIGERWSMSIVRELLLGPKHFAELQRDVAGIGPTMLTRRLSGLERSGVVRRTRSESGSGTHAYELTAWGRELESVNESLARWGARSPALPLDASMSPDTLVLAMRTHTRGRSSPGPGRSVRLHVRDSRRPGTPAVLYQATLAPEGVAIARTRPDEEDRCDARVACTTAALKLAVILGSPWRTVQDFSVQGDESAVDRLVAATRR